MCAFKIPVLGLIKFRKLSFLYTVGSINCWFGKIVGSINCWFDKLSVRQTVGSINCSSKCRLINCRVTAHATTRLTNQVNYDQCNIFSTFLSIKNYTQQKTSNSKSCSEPHKQ